MLKNFHDKMLGEEGSLLRPHFSDIFLSGLPSPFLPTLGSLHYSVLFSNFVHLLRLSPSEADVCPAQGHLRNPATFAKMRHKEFIV